MFHVAKVVLFLGFLAVVSVAAQPKEKRQYSEAELAKMSAEELVQEYSRVALTCRSCGDAIEKALVARDPAEVCTTIAKIIDEYDPTTPQGTKERKSEYAYWAIGLLGEVDMNHIRIRGAANGKVVLDAYRRMLERKEAAGHNVKPSRYSEKAYARRSLYEAETIAYQDLNGVNERDRQISQRLKAEHGVQLTDDELRRFADFLVTKNPRYVAWGDFGLVSKDPPKYAFRSPQRYYEAYLEFKSAAKNP